MPIADLTITNNHASLSLLENRTVSVKLDHTFLINQETSRTDGRDFYVTFNGEPQPVFVRGAGTNDATIFFSLREDLAPLTSDSTQYKLVYGYLNRPAFRFPDIQRCSQFQAWNNGYSPNRKEPFLFYDGFTHKRNGSNTEWEEYTTLQQLDSTIYSVDVAVNWVVSGGALYHVISPTPTNGRMTVSNLLTLTDMLVRVSVMIPSNATAMGVGTIVRGRNTAINGYLASIGPTDTVITLTEWAGNVLQAVHASSAITAAKARLVQVVNSAFSSTLWADIDGSTLLAVDTTETSGAPGLADISTASAASLNLFQDFIVELYDGVRDNEWVASVTFPTLSLPCSTLPEVHVLERGVVTTGGLFKSIRSWDVSPLNNDRFRLTYGGIGPIDYFDILAFAKQNQYGAQVFDYTLPEDVSSSKFRIVPGSLREAQRSATLFDVSLELERLPL